MAGKYRTAHFLSLPGERRHNETGRMTETALIVIDVQRAWDDPYWGKRNNPDCETNVKALLDRWVERGETIVLVRHDEPRDAGNPLVVGTPGNRFKPELDGVPAALVFGKNVHSAFHGEVDLHAWLTNRGITDLVICGIQTEKCVETTTRVGGNLGYRIRLPLDATMTFDKRALDGSLITADEVARMTAANLNKQFATIVSTQDVLG
jgi:nicotinamidase-related amidase